ncbi:rubrerythrin [bacterium BMS3Abin07]|nr:rubrerythrin [bacterium BMS3Abin07]GBE33073.1 rubrerythrin [bacterium BMS3Bbin05]HDO23214.1 hypothetical protein [Nitrospirota bacterium]HDZ87259.1 hypothetical protein [Nitrospirota bacterium]
MIKGKEDLQEAIVEALLMEKGTRDFYGFASSKACSEPARDLFGRLSDWEDQHMRYLQFLYRSLQGDLNLSSYEEFLEKAPADFIESGIEVEEAERLFVEKDFIDDAEAIILALEIEGKAYKLYGKLSGSAVYPNARVIFDEMMLQEQKHIDELRKLKRITG